MISEYHPQHFAELVKAMKKDVPCRDEEVDYMTGLLGQTPLDEPPAAVFVHGDSGTGKTLVLTRCLELGRFRHAQVNCHEAYSLKILYEAILDQLAGHTRTSANAFEPYRKCANLLDFVSELRMVSDKFGVARNDPKSRSVFIVLDKAEQLRGLDKTVLPAFLKLRELSGLKLCVVLVSHLPWSRFHLPDNTTEPIIVSMEQYTQKQVLEILSRDTPEGFTASFYQNYLQLLLSIFYQACHDLRELKHQAQLNFTAYSAPICAGELTESDASVLWKRAQPFFKKSLKSLYLKTDPEQVDKLTSVAAQALNMELPFYSKYLLLGAYIASFNPAADDKRLFLKNHGTIRKSAKARERVRHHLIGPKPFGLQRLFAIVSSILDDERFNLNANLFVEVASLVKMNLLVQMSEDLLDGATFKCNVGLQFIDVIAKNVQFPIRSYLVDFMDS